MNTLDQGNIIRIAVHHLSLVNGDVLAPVGCEQLRQQAQKRLVFPFSLG